jgi:hypothetical protein
LKSPVCRGTVGAMFAVVSAGAAPLFPQIQRRGDLELRRVNQGSRGSMRILMSTTPFRLVARPATFFTKQTLSAQIKEYVEEVPLTN